MAEQMLGAMRVLEAGISVEIKTDETQLSNNINNPRTPNEPIPSLWAVGTTIQISFIDGTDKQKQKVKDIAVEWLSYANVNFEFRDAASAIRISFAQMGDWTYPGTSALGIDADTRPTMNLGSVRPDVSVTASEPTAILHEFGHLLGLIHEHQNPSANLPWNVERVYSVFTRSQGWSRDRIDRVMIEPASSNKYEGYREFDRYSVMNFDIAPEFFNDGKGISPGTALSESDKQFISFLYPNQ